MNKDSSIKIEVAKSEDWEVYRNIRIEALTKNPEAFGSTLAEALSKPDEYWQSRLAREDLFIVLARADNSLEGAKSITGARIEEGVWKIIAVYTRPEFRRQGLAEKVLREVLNEIKRRGGSKVTLNVTARTEQEAARAVYKKLGFKEVEMCVDEGENIYKMELDLENKK